MYASMLASSLFISASALDNLEPNVCNDCDHHHHHEDGLNRYKLLVTVGMDELLDESALSFGIQIFDTLPGWDAERIEQFRQAAISWHYERFGVDFRTAPYDPSTGFSDNGYATLVPLQFNGTYRILESNDHRIPVGTRINITEFVVQFHPDVSMNYGGTYGASATTPIAISPSDSLPYGVYTVFTSERHPKEFFMRGFFPDKTEPVNLYPSRSFERFQMFSENYGPGFGILNVAVPGVPNSSGKWPTYVKAQWSFPGSFVIPDYNGWRSAPIPPVAHHSHDHHDD